MQYTFGDMIGELFMKALALEEQRKIREEEKAYKDEVMRYQRGRDKTLDERYAKDKEIEGKRWQDELGYKDKIFQENQSQFNANYRQNMLPVPDINAIPKEVRPFVTSGKQQETTSGRDFYKTPEEEGMSWVDKALLNDAWQREAADRNARRMMGANNPDNRKVEFYKYDKDGNLLQTILASPNEMKNTYLNPNDKKWEKNKDYIFSSQPAMGNLLLNQRKFDASKDNKFSTEAGIMSVLTQALGNQYANKLGRLSQIVRDDEYYNQFKPQTISEDSNIYVPGVGGINIDNSIMIKQNKQSWSRQKTANAQFIKGLLDETINPLAEALNALKRNAKTGADIKSLQQISAMFGAMYPDLDKMRTLFDKGLVYDPNNELKKQFYEGLRKSQRYWQTENVLSRAMYNQKFQKKLEDEQIKKDVEQIQD